MIGLPALWARASGDLLAPIVTSSYNWSHTPSPGSVGAGEGLKFSGRGSRGPLAVKSWTKNCSLCLAVATAIAIEVEA